MNWVEIQQKLNDLNDKYLELTNDTLFLGNETNYETKNQNINNMMFYLVKAIKNKIKDMPSSVEQIRQQVMNYGNDINSISNYLIKLDDDFKSYETGMQVLRTLIELSDKEYAFEGSFENSLFYKQKIDTFEKMIEMMDKDNLTIEEKYEYVDSFDKKLSDEDKGELHVQALIGKDENHITDGKLAQLLLMAFKGNIKKVDDYYQFALEIGAVAENKMDNKSLEKQLEYLSTILVSPYVQNMKQSSKNK